MPPLPPRLRIALGVVGSLLIAAGSFGVGWTAPASGVDAVPVIALIRQSRTAVVCSAVAVALGAVLLVAAWLSLGLALRPGNGRATPASVARRGESTLRHVVVSATAWGLPLMVALPLFSRDLFSYLAQGRLIAAGFNPYATGVAVLPDWAELGADGRWATAPTPYGPVYLGLEGLVTQATAGMPVETGLLAYRLISAGGLVLVGWAAYRLAVVRGLDPGKVLWLVVANPLALTTIVLAGHNDAVMIGLVLTAVLQAVERRPALALALLALAVGVKPIAAVAIPVIGLIWAGQGASWWKVIGRWAASAALVLGAVVLLGVAMGVGAGWIGALATPLGGGSWYAPARLLSQAAGLLAAGFGGDPRAAGSAIGVVVLAIGALAVALLFVAGRRRDPVELLAGAFALLLLVSPAIHPWYGFWLICLIAVAGVRRAWMLRLIVVASAFLLLIGMWEPTDLIPRLTGDPAIFVPVTAIAVGGLLVVVALYEVALRRRFSSRGRPPPQLQDAPARVTGISASSTPSG
ncbi:polyprenol phosphomannose-dependent alpha 1,6 mannosyltransferase MptB [Herbiconiux sp. KACC 21604]|uniref:polyprenol phosphomannose-dependent alpha 1,6 mannosyltransferase MptB n=1 Tax=unclassified Herbiconiux TaxID=2618217 RepID=UPI00149198B6|nr:polyprenol phosphomannose-dependent alpha 1,6 mannosyltransferase MptB [Herbiconiux sp. SALV-R1]QJU55384.1 polyprenol phosphomannose-dependent alpha 1,6 mannosyltransferase MptB [Herbiconiux sp. SALV-R1]WPO86557.1 polyprenol phosphomannose-dependent alpha 1,6 mannosyltransferase MptB [Herbiconiux sp. KACC 21604]